MRPLPPSGGLYFPFTLQLKVPHFSQTDPRWASHYLGHTPGTLAQEGCAVASAAMVLAFRGANITPASLNQFLTHHPRGYTQNGRIWWEDAAEFDPALTTQLLPHYENLPSYALLDLNLFRQNPVIARIRLPSSQTHFVVIVGKKNFDYLVLDPAQSHQPIPLPLANLYPFPIEAIRFYRPR
ncbi:MAG: C39 family peptidase [Chthoniobacterales bacterium]|nr:C39 family peptidase [Chthoniobacterales bacterium]